MTRPRDAGIEAKKATTRPWLMHTQVAVSGAVVMLVEILGTRIVGPVFGVGLFVWSALLAVTLAALAAGYFIGGIIADRAAKQDRLSWVMLGAGVALALEPLLRAPTLSFADDLGLKVGPVVAAVVLFFPTLCLLGMVGPIAIQRSVHTLNVTGRRVGWVYALSTVGSLVGTFAVGFYLIPTFSVNSLVGAASAVLLLFSVLPLLIAKQRIAATALIALLPAFNAEPRPMPNGFDLVDRRESLLGLVEVIDEKERNVRFLRMDHSVIGAQFIDTHAAGFAFQHIMQSLRFARPEARTVLQIGLGAGTVPTALSHQGKIVDSVEIDPVIVSLAQKHFGFVANGELAMEDARAFLRRSEKSYGAIIHDTFSGGTSPEHLFSREMLTLLKKRLNPGGLLVLNFVGFATGAHVEATLAVRSTLSAQFANVRAFRDSALDQAPGEVSNIIFFASDVPVSFAIPADAAFETPECEATTRAFQNWEVLKNEPLGSEITDAHNPLARLQAPIVAAHYEGMKHLLPKEVWIR